MKQHGHPPEGTRHSSQRSKPKQVVEENFVGVAVHHRWIPDEADRWLAPEDELADAFRDEPVVDDEADDPLTPEDELSHAL